MVIHSTRILDLQLRFITIQGGIKERTTARVYWERVFRGPCAETVLGVEGALGTMRRTRRDEGEAEPKNVGADPGWPTDQA